MVDGVEMYIWCPNGLRDSPPMTALGETKSGPSATVRNWNTVEKLHAMMSAHPGKAAWRCVALP
ncbi:hypothetical protein KIF24_29425 [Micromonospora sp. Llam7]|uniref:hypothetical protein n=1 Tax=Micromonospora tarapacensis TaxID=2835305 RepID=UPI001C829533|nr:hypothetical protein [Micromonospora tarapacensis]MBX7269732.1 hypothetical protein [Micromonospora tarapacensis]